MRWLLLDEILEIKKGEKARVKSRVPEAEFSSEVLLIEMMAQAGGILLGAEKEFKEDVIFAKIEAARFPIPLRAGEEIEIIAAAEALRPEGSWMDTVVQNSRGVLASARILLMNSGALVPGKTNSTTFHRAFMEHFKILEKIR